MGFGKKLVKAVTFSPAKAVWKWTNKGNKMAQNSLNEGIVMADKYAKEVADVGEVSHKQMQGLGDRALEIGGNYKQNVEEGIKASNEGFEDSRKQANIDLANMGYTPQSNEVYARSNAEYSKQKLLADEQIRNSANDRVYNAKMQGLNVAGGC